MRTSVRSRRPLADQLVPRGVRDQVGEALERDGVAVAHELGDRLASGTISAMAQKGNGLVPLCTVTQRSSVNSWIAAVPAEAAPAAVLDAAERHLRLVADRLVVDVDDARLDAAARARGPDRCRS